MIVIQFPVTIEGPVLQLIGQIEAKDASYVVKIHKDVDEETIKKLKELNVVVIQPIKP